MYGWRLDRARAKVVDFEVSESREFSAYLPMALRLESRYEIEISCSDYYDVYAKYRIAQKQKQP